MDDTVDRARIAPSQRPPEPGRPASQPQFNTKPPRRSRLARWVVAVVLAIVCIFGWEEFQKYESTGEKPNGGGAPPQTIRDAAVTSGDMPIVINALGAVTPLATVTVRTQVNGQLQQIAFTEGQMVKAGDFLAQVDPRPFQATLDQYSAQFAKDTALYNQAQSDLQRYQTLSKQDSIAMQQVADQEFLVKQDRAAMASDQALMDAAKLNITYAHIVSPVTGRVGLRQVDQGNYVQTTDANGIVVVTELEPISVIFTVPEDDLPQIFARLNAGASLPVTAFDRANVKQLATGVLGAVDNQIDTTTGTVKIRATFDNKDDVLFPQQFVNVGLLVDTMSNATLAPNAAIQQGSQGAFVYVVNADDTVSVRQVKTGPSNSANTAILSGLKVGENVVVDGVDRLRDGAKVSVRNNSLQPGGNSGAADGSGGAGEQGQHRGQHRHGQGGPGQQGSNPQDQSPASPNGPAPAQGGSGGNQPSPAPSNPPAQGSPNTGQ